MQEKKEKLNIYEGENRAGYINVCYPVFPKEYKRLNYYYENIASSYVRFAEKKIPKLRKMTNRSAIITCVFFAEINYSDDNFVCIVCETRIYKGEELYFKKSFSNVWELPGCTLKYKRKFGIKRSSVGYNGRELYLFEG